MPEERWRDRDLTILRGCWNRYSNMQVRQMETGRLIGVRSWVICFDEAGHGRQTITLNDGRRCEQPLQARFGGNETLDVDEIGRCDFGHGALFHGAMVCRRESDTEASCPRIELEGPTPGHPIGGQFRRAGGQQ